MNANGRGETCLAHVDGQAFNLEKSMRHTGRLFVVVLLMIGIAGCTSSPEKYEYLLYLPEGYAEQEASWPLLLFLHGAGERGDSLALVNVHGPPKLIEQGQGFPFIVVSPQCPEDQRWSVKTLDKLLNDIVAQYRVDEDRIYVTGLSMGGFGTWNLAARFPHRFAAIAPICGGGVGMTTLYKIRNSNLDTRRSRLTK